MNWKFWRKQQRKLPSVHLEVSPSGDVRGRVDWPSPATQQEADVLGRLLHLLNNGTLAPTLQAAVGMAGQRLADPNGATAALAVWAAQNKPPCVSCERPMVPPQEVFKVND
jgi:hypothetical protein